MIATPYYPKQSLVILSPTSVILSASEESRCPIRVILR